MRRCSIFYSSYSYNYSDAPPSIQTILLLVLQLRRRRGPYLPKDQKKRRSQHAPTAEARRAVLACARSPPARSPARVVAAVIASCACEYMYRNVRNIYVSILLYISLSSYIDRCIIVLFVFSHNYCSTSHNASIVRDHLYCYFVDTLSLL